MPEIMKLWLKGLDMYTHARTLRICMTICGSTLANVQKIPSLQHIGMLSCSLGVCPQFDILWPEITVREHLTLYAEIKGYSRRDARAVADAAGRDVGQCLSWHAAPTVVCQLWVSDYKACKLCL